MGLITDPEAKITGCGKGCGEGSGSSNRSRIRADGKHSDTFRVIRSLKVSALCFHSFVITP